MQNRPTVIISTDGSKSGGISSYCQTLVEKLTIDRVIIIGDNEVNWQTQYTTLRRWGRAPLLLFDFKKYYKILKSCKNSNLIINDPQITSVTFLIIVYNILNSANNRKSIFVSHGFLFHQSNSFLKKFYFFIFIKLLSTQMQIISISAADSECLRNVRVKNFVEITHGFEIQKPHHSRLRDVYAICIGRNSKNKNLEYFIELARITPEKSFVLVTDEIENSNLPQNLRVLSKIERDRLATLMQSSQFVVSFSNYEGFGMAVLECISAGSIPVLYTNTSFNKIFENNEIYLFDTLDVHTVKQKLESLQNVDHRETLCKILAPYDINDKMVQIQRQLDKV